MLITHFAPLSVVSEAYKMARTNIEFSAIDTKVHSLVVTSSNQSEGKSATVANIAITYAQAGRKVLLVDSDMRRPSIHKLFGISNRHGLTNALLHQDSWEIFVNISLTENLDIITSGPLPPNPAELLMSERMGDFIEKARSRYDMVLFDCAPVGAVTDAAILSTKVDATVFVVRSNHVDRNQLKRATAMLQKVNAKVLGYILTGITKKTEDNFNYYYNNEYYYENNKKHRINNNEYFNIDKSIKIPVSNKKVSDSRNSPFSENMSLSDLNVSKIDSAKITDEDDSTQHIRIRNINIGSVNSGIVSEDD
jgi:capsular exopolysaccharide synthesis family protein